MKDLRQKELFPTSSREDFLVRTSALQEKERDYQVNGQDCGSSWPELLEKWGHGGSSLKMSASYDLEDFSPSCKISARSGMMRSGTVSQLPTLVRLTRGTGTGYWATPTVNKSIQCSMEAARKEAARLHPQGRYTLATQVAETMWPTPSSRDHKGGYIGGRIRNGKISWDTLDVAVQWTDNQTKDRGALNPTWVEWLMGYPEEWTDLSS